MDEFSSFVSFFYFDAENRVNVDASGVWSVGSKVLTYTPDSSWPTNTLIYWSVNGQFDGDSRYAGSVERYGNIAHNPWGSAGHKPAHWRHGRFLPYQQYQYCNLPDFGLPVRLDIVLRDNDGWKPREWRFTFHW